MTMLACRSRRPGCLPTVALLCAFGALPATGQPRRSPSPPSADPAAGAKSYLLQAQTALRRREPRRAIAVLQQGLVRYPRSASLHYAAARLLAQEGDFTQSRVHYQRMVALDPRAVAGYFGLAQVTFALKEYDASAAALRQALRLQPTSATAYAKLGMVYVQQQKTQQAIATFRKALALTPNSDEAHFYLGDLMRRLSRLDEAQPHLEQAIAISPNNPHFYLALGELFLQRQESPETLSRSLAAYQQAAALDPAFAEAYYGIGRVYARQRRWPEAAEALRRCLLLNPRMGRAHFTLAQVCRRLGQPAEAAAHLQAFRRYRAGQGLAVSPPPTQQAH
jgi:protein O-GlcNAc transferase